MRLLTIEQANKGSKNPTLIKELVSYAEADPEVQNGKPFYCQLLCEVTWIYVPLDQFEKPMFYLACQICKRKVVDNGNRYECAFCDKTSESAIPTYNFQVLVSDCSGSIRL